MGYRTLGDPVQAAAGYPDVREMLRAGHRSARAATESWHYRGAGAMDVAASSPATVAAAREALREWSRLRNRQQMPEVAMGARTVAWGARFTRRLRVQWFGLTSPIMLRVSWLREPELRDRIVGSQLDLAAARAEQTLAGARRRQEPWLWRSNHVHLHVGRTGRERLRRMAGSSWVRGLTGPTALDAMGREAEELWTHD